MTDHFLIEQYLKGKLSKRQESIMIERIRTEPDFKEKVLIKVLLIRAIKNVGRRNDERVIRNTKEKLTWKRYILVYGMYGNYYFTDNMKRYNFIFSHRTNASII